MTPSSLLPLALAVVLLSSPAFSYTDACDGSQPPSFCQGLDCPTFTLMCCDNSSSKDFRRYDAAWWVRTEVDGGDLDNAGNIGFHRLFDYISGANVQNISIDMTTPVSNQIFYENPRKYIIAFFAPFLYQTKDGPPEPTDPLVYKQYLPARMVAVSDMSGYVGDREEEKLLGGLEKYCTERGIKYTKGYSWFNGYNAPFQPIHRHNEVMVDIYSDPCPVV